jgi:DHA2 family multidrug resistance protein
MALGHLSAGELPDASALFNLMRNLGGAIGIALVDTVIWSRAPMHAGRLVERLRAGDLDAARTIGIPEAYLAGPLPSADDPIVRAFVRPLVERAALVTATNEAWALIAGFVLIGVPTVILFRFRPGSQATHG